MIRDKVNYVIKRYGTRDPFRIAKEKDILILYEDLGSIQGYYNKQFRTKQIHINRNIPDSAIQEYTDQSFTIEQIARIYGYTVELIKLKL